MDPQTILAKLGIGETSSGACGTAWIDNPGGGELVSINPSTGQPLARVAMASAADYEQVAAAAHDTFLRWRMHPAPKRGEVIRQIGLALREHKQELGELVSLEMGKILAEGLGEVFAAETGFVLQEDPATVRAADAAFVRKDRLPDPVPEGFFPGAPDLAVEVISPGDLAQEVERKVEDYLQAGTRLVWLIYPVTQTVMVYRAPREIRVCTREDELSGEDVLPGFRCLVAELLA